METLLYLIARVGIALLQALPLTTVARLGRVGGGAAYWLDVRHRRVAARNLRLCFGREKSAAEIRALAREHFRRLGENYACAVKTAAMSPDELRAHLEFAGAELLGPGCVAKTGTCVSAATLPGAYETGSCRDTPARRRPTPAGQKPRTVVAAIGHFGNFELYARFGQFAPAYQCATTYRGLRQPSLDRLLLSLRKQSGCLYFERRTDAAALRAAMNQPGIMLGLLADQRAVRGGIRVPFFGHECSTSAACAVFALRYGCNLHTAICYRLALARWRIEIGPAIPTRENGAPRPPREITTDINRAFEAAVRRDPANWFWVHDRWKPYKTVVPTQQLQGAQPPAALKLENRE
jgi:KDO2-lipid IV(A) lauroyltransferase